MSGDICVTCGSSRRLFPVAVLTRKWCRSYHCWRVHLKVTERGNLLDQVRVMACNTVLRVCHISIMVPLLIAKLNIGPAMAVSCQTVPVNGYIVFTVRINP